jgi:membrane-associated phospholipid phosphatase
MLERLKFEFAPEWLALAAIAIADAIWARAIGFHLIVTWHDLKQPAVVLALTLFLRFFSLPRAALAAELLGLWLVMAPVFQLLSYLCMASSGPLVDSSLMSMDRMMGFDWLAGYHLVLAHPKILWLLNQLYDSFTWQTLYFCVLMGLMNRAGRMRELVWIIFLCTVITDLGAMLFPALGPFYVFGLNQNGGFLPDMQHLISRHDLSFVLAKLTGVVSFPSFHTIMALAFIYGFRKLGPISFAVGAANMVMLVSVPFIGGHYLTDMLGGALVFVAVTLAVRQAKHFARPRAGSSWFAQAAVQN